MNPTKRFYFDARTQEILESITIPFAIYQYIDKRVVTIALSQGFCSEFGFKKLEDAYHAMDSDMYRATHPDDKTRVADAAYRFAAFDVPYDIVYRTRTLKDPDYIILHAYGKSVYPKPGVRLCLTWYAYEGHYSQEQGMYENVLSQTLSRFLTEESQYRGMYYDYMTGLPNMAYFYELAEAGCKKMQEQNIDSAILFFDLTGLKQFNHRYGFEEGNKLIRTVAAILAKQFSSENCARFAQDHFAAFATEEGLRERLDAVIEECADANDGKSLPVRIGIYPNRIEEVEIGTACDRARLAANSRKNPKGSFVAFFDMDMMAEEKNRQEIIDNLDKAIEEDRIKVYYQPIVRSASGKVCDLEALARWDDPVRGLLPPSAFIPVLEEAGLIHKLDLCVVKRVLEDLKRNKEINIPSVPISINFSRADFDACDLVDEITGMVDAAQIERKLINIEVTESMVGSDFDYMKEQIERFRAQGFQVWMDDFGSGYSSLDVLQSIEFDLIKFDMSFMKRLDEGENGKIILKEMMRMATSLGTDTICEGVETEKQVRFLQEVGCSKLQGYYFMKPVPCDQIEKRYFAEKQSGFEDPRESTYFETMGSVNLYDLSFLANMDDSVIKNTFDTVPMGIMEIGSSGDKVRYIRSNQSFREFMSRAFGFDLSDPKTEFFVPNEGPGSSFMKAIEQCRNNGNRAFVDEEIKDGSIVRSFVRIIAVNQVTGTESVAIAVLSITEPDESTTYADMARALAADYYNVFVIDLDTNEYTEYSSQVGGEELKIERRGVDFFESARRDTMIRIYEEDREPFLSIFTKENVLRELDAQGVFTTTYRLVDTGVPMYVNMKITRMRGGNRIILGVSIVDSQMKHLEEEKRLRQEKAALGRIAALSPDYIVLYTVDPLTGHYTQYSPSDEFESFGLDRQGEDFFADVILDAPKAIAPEDMERHLRVLTEENMMHEIQKNGFFIHNYGLILDGETVPVSLRATLAREDDREMIVLGVSKEHTEEPQDNQAERPRKYSELLRENEQLKKEAAIVRKIAELKESVSSLLTNMPGLTFSKDVATGRYLACNQAFAEYANKEKPEGVVGLTDYEIFDQETAAHFVEDDQKALGMDEPYVFFEDVLDGAGQRKQFQTTKLKFTDSAGRQCLLGLCQDMTDAVRYQRESILTKEAYEEAHNTSIIYARLQALTGDFMCVYVVDPETSHYHEFSASGSYEDIFAQAREGTDFFTTLRDAAGFYSHPDDQKRVLSLLTRDSIIAEVERSGIFTLAYRLMVDGRPLHVQMKAAMVEEKEGMRLIVGLSDVDAQVRQEEEYGKRLAQAQTEANIDALTGVKNKHAYLVSEAHIDHQIEKHRQSPFAIVIFDVNDLKKVNDTYGHQAGDQYICDACKIICDAFKHSPVFRVGGDEFAVIAEGNDYTHIEELAKRVDNHNEKASQSGGVVIACGMARFNNDTCVASVFERADQNMYKNKNALKEKQNGKAPA